VIKIRVKLSEKVLKENNLRYLLINKEERDLEL